MRWRFVDRIDTFAPWHACTGRKTVSLEEYSLLDRLGRRGVLPETLLLECCVALARWLVIRSSDFRQLALLGSVEHVAVGATARPGEIVVMDVAVLERGEELRARCAARVGDRTALHGVVGLQLRPVRSCCDESVLRKTWEKLHEPVARA